MNTTTFHIPLDDDLKKFKDGSDPEGHPNTDWYRLAFRTALVQPHNVNLSGTNALVRHVEGHLCRNREYASHEGE